MVIDFLFGYAAVSLISDLSKIANVKRRSDPYFYQTKF